MLFSPNSEKAFRKACRQGVAPGSFGLSEGVFGPLTRLARAVAGSDSSKAAAARQEVRRTGRAGWSRCFPGAAWAKVAAVHRWRGERCQGLSALLFAAGASASGPCVGSAVGVPDCGGSHPESAHWRAAGWRSYSAARALARLPQEQASEIAAAGEAGEALIQGRIGRGRVDVAVLR